MAKAQGVPAPPPPADVQAQIDAARRLLWVFDASGNNTGQQTPLYSQYEQLSATWAGATAAYSLAEAQASTNPAQAAVWPVTSKALQVAVQNAWNDWRSAGANRSRTRSTSWARSAAPSGLTWCPRPGTCSRSGIWG